MTAFDPTKYEIRIQAAINGYIVHCGCCGPIVFATYPEMEEELAGFMTGVLGRIGKQVWEKYQKSLGETTPGGALVETQAQQASR